MKIAITGASGFVGTALQQIFFDCVIIHRNDDQEAILKKLRGVDIVINLAGAPIIKRWSDPYKEILQKSRIETTKTLVQAINQSEVSHFISTSAIGIYPDNQKCDESCTQTADDFLGNLARRWEEEAFLCNKPTAILRFGVVLGKEGGALAQMLTPFRLGVGGIIADGKMMTSWIDIEDLMGIYRFLIDHRLTGIYNAVSPHPVSNYVFTKALGKVLRRPTILPIPKFVLRIMYGEAASVLTGSKEVYPKALMDQGFTFTFPNIDEALEHIAGS
ncbi:MAG TPA: TIGR01777 family protein [Sulfurovum sp. UBA12169]|nr:MAG TPA: TIGR01777 family protein [Sulfurovum sp. UBA12169]